MRLVKLLAFFFLFAKLDVAAQYYSTGDDPAGIKWKEIKTRDFQLIFPDDYKDKAMKLAFIMEKVYAHAYQTLNHRPKPISLVLHTRTLTSNGLVSWAPKRIEFYTTPSQQTYAQDWIAQLAIHEFRHVVQIDKVESELPGIIRFLFGEQAAAVVIGTYLPFWLIEGDAVMTETALSPAGRGRLPLFLMENRAQLVEKGLFSYDKATLGSYRDFVPNRYKFGYWFAGTIREQYGTDVWADVLKETGSKPFSLNPVNRILKQKTGFTKEQLYNRIFSNYAEKWKQETTELETSPYSVVNQSGKAYVSYKYIHALNDSGFIALRESRTDIDRIVRVNSGKEQLIVTPGLIPEESMSVTGDLIIWAEQRADLRWTHASRSVIVIHDMKNKTIKEFRPSANLLAPAIAPDLKSFVAVESDFRNNYHLAIFDLQTGEKTAVFATPDNNYFFTPVWDQSSTIIYFVGLSSKGKYLGSLNRLTGEFKALSSPDYRDLRNPEFHNGKLYYTSARTGIDNIFSIDLSTGIVSQLTSVPFGADYPSVSGNSLYFSNYSSNGYRVAVQDVNSFSKDRSATEEMAYTLAEKLANQEDTIFYSFDPSDHQLVYEAKPYNKLAHLFNFHSWAPLYINVNDYEITPGFSLLSQNKLGTATALLGYRYDPSEKTGKYKAEFEYSGLFPVFRTEFSYGNRKSAYYKIVNRDTIRQPYSWKEVSFDFNTRLPFTFDKGKSVRFFQPQINYNYEKIIQDEATPDRIFDGYYHSLTYRLFLQNVVRKAELDILPEWGQIFDFYYRHGLGGGTKINELQSAESWLYFPGMMKTHGIRLYSGYQHRTTDKLLAFSDVVRFPRGYNKFNTRDLYTFGGDYMLPVCYPDQSIGRLFFLKRLRTSLFFDYAHYVSVLYNKEGVRTGTIEGNLKAAGAELTADGHAFRLIAPVSAGIRGTYRSGFNDLKIEFLLNISFDFL